ncbi:hypothetical protein [Streptomyces rapamycinicus]|uniref:Uncharacterized protein n=2 Tax=Streptomyces rapamycinicus TaxID=1226757 RepID=A0A0A0NL54_STRRN|nr:hypothetical protein [Streptomyces rapamycinicus]AGP56838.1 hypothetical protein M271_26830 [Streptomyces rapamycinicus NRRL 5491]MBB4784454.1 hypothetical protein [Streptomyces rapamycinicus]RLV80063.1 hypothetical protein D3C57_116800 [Streptomyces rapamycinicus NRRL 5491]UTO64762.1 hypothetical protein LJB45_22145 [Streptomyces rapamycinicus]UTP32719.1 hypothetical protein LIV37_27270 [Streptomyces rapamycinicus NRRL 5491]
MSLDAMDWVWTRSTAKGTARMVLLAIADKCPDDACTAYAGTTMLVQRTNAARSSVVAAVDKLLDGGELRVVEGSKGPRGETVYHLPRAVGHVRSMPEDIRFRGLESGPVQNPDRSENRPPEGRETGPEGYGNRTPTGPESGPQNAYERKHQAEQQQARATRSALIPELGPLDGALATAGIPVRWSLGLGEQRDVWRLVQAHGVEALVARAATRTTPGAEPKPARYWLRVWGDLDRAPAARPGPATAAPYTDNLAAGLALLHAQKEGNP